MRRRVLQSPSGSAVIGLVVIAVIILGALLTFNASALVSIGGTSRAIELARQNALLANRLEQTTREATYATFGTSIEHVPSLCAEVQSAVARVGFGDVSITGVTVDGGPGEFAFFPTLTGSPSELHVPSTALLQVASPQLHRWMGPLVAESDSFRVRFSVERSVFASRRAYVVEVGCRLVAVPLTRFQVIPYDLPQEVGSAEGSARWPEGVPIDALVPLGLVPGRDPADVGRLDPASSIAGASQSGRPGHYRCAAAVLATCQYVFSSAYLQRVADYAGSTHFVRIGDGASNPVLTGATAEPAGLRLDLGTFGRGVLAGVDALRDTAVITSTDSGQRVVLTDSGGASTPVLIVVLGSTNPAHERLTLEIAGALRRPLVVIGCKVSLVWSPGAELSGALLLDPECAVSSPAGALGVGHVSYWAGGPVNSSQFRLLPLPQSVAAISPRVVYVATEKRIL